MTSVLEKLTDPINREGFILEVVSSENGVTQNNIFHIEEVEELNETLHLLNAAKSKPPFLYKGTLYESPNHLYVEEKGLLAALVGGFQQDHYTLRDLDSYYVFYLDAEGRLEKFKNYLDE